MAAQNLYTKQQVRLKFGESYIDFLLHVDYFTTKTIFERNHFTILSVEFEEAFDRTMDSCNFGSKLFHYLKPLISHRSESQRQELSFKKRYVTITYYVSVSNPL